MRFFLTLLVVLALSSAGEAQQPKKISRIGRLSPLTSFADSPIFEALRQGLRDLGWVEGRNITFEHRFAEGKLDRLPELAAELVRLKVDVFIAGSTPGALAAKNATAAIPIVMVTTGDPIAAGLVASLARPGGNVTGLTALGLELSGKRLEVLMEAVPSVGRVAVLSDPVFPESGPSLKGAKAAARALRVQLRVQEVGDPTEFEKAFAAMPHEGAGALIVLTGPMFLSQRERIVALAAKSRLPAMYAFRESVDAGGLILWGRAA